MSQERRSACIPPPSDYSQHVRPHGQHRERPDRSNHKHRASFHDRQSSQQHHQPTTFHRDPPRHYDSQLEESTNDIKRTQPRDRFHKNDDDDYFACVKEEDESTDVQAKRASIDENNDDDDDEEDPLEAYMKSLEENSVGAHERKTEDTLHTHTNSASGGPVRLDIDGGDDIEESYYQFVEKKTTQQHSDDDEQLSDNKQDLVEYDKDGNVISVRKIKREVDPLLPIDHSKILYEKFEKSFYKEHNEILQLTQEQTEELRKKLEIRVSGRSPPKPVCSFAHFKFDEKILKVIRRSEYVQPTPIQAQAIPTILSGRNVIGIAITGSGKTAAYLWPMIVHINEQVTSGRGDGPIGLILVPTRELALQVYAEAKKFSNSYKLKVVCAYGGGSRFEQSRDLESGAEIVVATPGRLIDLIKSEATNLRRVTYLVLDEADRFFEMGFEAQVRSICDHVRPDRQTLLFSATFKHKVEQLARTVTEDPVKIVQKTLGEANEDVAQHAIVFYDAAKKLDWLSTHLVEFASAGGVLIFVTRIINSEELHKRLEEDGRDCLLLHGDMEQSERNRVITCFKKREKDILVATDVAARGLDIAHIRTVINYDVARDIDTHTHRIGRTGRAGTKGDAYTLLSADKDKDFAGQLVKCLESSNQQVSEELLKVAMQSHAFRKSRNQRQHKELGHRLERHDTTSRPRWPVNHHQQSNDMRRNHGDGSSFQNERPPVSHSRQESGHFKRAKWH